MDSQQPTTSNQQRTAPMVSVLMAVYNAEKYLTEAVESILVQTFADFEFLIIDDGSVDGSAAILEDYAESDERVKVIHNSENLGLTKSLNIGLKLTQGKFIARIDADDVAVPERFEKQITFMDDHPDIGVCGSCCS